MNPVFSIGHSDHDMEAFLALLVLHGISAIADVRASPYSRHQPQFSRGVLVDALRDAGVAYVYLGDALGGLPSARVRTQMKGTGYAAIAATDAFQQGIGRLQEGRGRHRIAIMCAEREPIECHRALLVGRALAGRSVVVEHIHADGRSETQVELESRLLAAAGHEGGGDLFSSQDELLDLAYLRQEKRVSLVDDDGART